MSAAAAIVLGAFGLLWTLDAFRIRRRARALAVLPKSDAPVAADHVFLVRPGVVLDEATRCSASAFARERMLEALDLVPADLPGWRTLLLLQSVDPSVYREQRLGTGRTAGDAMLVTTGLLDRMRLPPELREPKDALGFAELALRVKRYAALGTDLAIAPELRAGKEEVASRGRLLERLFGDLAAPVILAQIVLAIVAPALSPIVGTAALVAMHLQCVIATAGTPLRPRDRVRYTVIRTLVDLVAVLGMLAPRPRAPSKEDEERRVAYAGLLANGTSRFFEPRRDDCPLCGGRALRVALVTGDHFQFKPGTFRLERCAGCAHVFQNPRLSLEGLDFYYRDFYDGLGEEKLERLFGFNSQPYVARAKMVAHDGRHPPSRWLDVGAGHGHFCWVAREVWPGASFDGLDLSESIEDAARRGWVDQAYRGLFPEIAGSIAAKTRYDVVSMSHYLEHTRDPRAEIEAAASVLEPGGVLLIEVPDPDSRMGRLLGSYWIPWFQPQHQHLLSVRNLERLLAETAFEPLVWHRGEAHQRCDLTFFTYTLLASVARPVDVPWRVRGPIGASVVRVWSRLVWLLGTPLIAISWIADRLLGPLLRRAGWSNTYRVLARRKA